MPQLTQADKAERFDKLQAKKKHQQVLDHVTMLRVAETATNGVVSAVAGAVKEARPAWESAAYGLPIDGAITALGLGLFIIAPESKKGDLVRELGGGFMQSGIGSLGQKGGRALYKYLAA